jgi:hypothetical protein
VNTAHSINNGIIIIAWFRIASFQNKIFKIKINVKIKTQIKIKRVDYIFSTYC